jgi:hypothetical protein
MSRMTKMAPYLRPGRWMKVMQSGWIFSQGIKTTPNDDR